LREPGPLVAEAWLNLRTLPTPEDEAYDHAVPLPNTTESRDDWTPKALIDRQIDVLKVTLG